MKNVYESRTPVQIVEGCLKLTGKEYMIFGGYLRDMLDPSNVDQKFNDVDILIDEDGMGIFIEILKATGFIRSVEKVVGNSYSTRSLNS